MTNYYFSRSLNFLSKIMRKIKLPLKICVPFNKRYHRHIMHELLPLFNKVYNNNLYNDMPHRFNKIIWMFWWQGIINRPFIVNKCIKSVIKYSGEFRVIVINRNNVKKYADIPNYIYKKLYNGEITFTHFSDILRFNLLSKYGGLWIDSTMFCTSTIKVPLNSYKDIYTSGGYPDKYHFFVSSKWTGFLIGGYSNNPIFLFMNDFFETYWKDNNRLIDYFLIDYALYFVYKKNINHFRYYVNNIAYKNNPHLHDLQPLLNYKYNSNTLKQLTYDTNLFKLTYKKKFKLNNTFYEKLFCNSK